MNDMQPERAAAGRWSPRLLHALSDSPDLPTAAEHLALQGIPVFPCAPGGKRPLTNHGFHDASADLDAVRAWWHRFPEANVGVPTGSASGVDIVDVDVHLADSGFPALEQARFAGFVDGWASLVRTPSGGAHAYFPREGVGEQRSWQVPRKHIDFRGDGGYIIVPPSRVADDNGRTRVYRQIAIAEHHQPRPVDGPGLRAFLDPPRPTPPPADMPTVGSRPDKLAAWVAARHEGGRNGGLFWAACRMAEEGHDYHDAAKLLGDAAHAAGLPEREALATIRSAYRTACPSRPAGPAQPTRAIEAVGL